MENESAAMQTLTRVIDIVIPLLEVADIFRLSVVCKDFQRITQSSWLWKQVMDQSLQMPQPLAWRHLLSDSKSSRKAAAPAMEVWFAQSTSMGAGSSFFSVHR